MINSCCCSVFSLALREQYHFVRTGTNPKCPLFSFCLFATIFIVFLSKFYTHLKTNQERERMVLLFFCIAVFYNHPCCPRCWPWSGPLSCRCFEFSLPFIFCAFAFFFVWLPSSIGLITSPFRFALNILFALFSIHSTFFQLQRKVVPAHQRPCTCT